MIFCNVTSTKRMKAELWGSISEMIDKTSLLMNKLNAVALGILLI